MRMGGMVDKEQSARNAWPDWARYAFDERAAIMHFDGGLSLEDAERKAEAAVLLELAQRTANRTKQTAPPKV